MFLLINMEKTPIMREEGAAKKVVFKGKAAAVASHKPGNAD